MAKSCAILWEIQPHWKYTSPRGWGHEAPKLLLLCSTMGLLWSNRLQFSVISTFIFCIFLSYHFLVKADAFHINVLTKIPMFSQKLLWGNFFQPFLLSARIQLTTQAMPNCQPCASLDQRCFILTRDKSERTSLDSSDILTRHVDKRNLK